MNFYQFTTKSPEEATQMLRSSQKGLTEGEVEKRQRTFGFNEFEERKINALDILIRQFKSAFFYLLFIVAIIYFLLEN